MSASTRASASTEGNLAQIILILRGQRVVLDADLAALYGVATKRFNEQVKRNRHRFPDDFMFQLTTAETLALRSQIATSKETAVGRGGRRTRAYAFTEHGALMAATVLNSPRAVETSIYLVRAFVRLRELLASNAVLERRLDEIEKRLERKLVTHDEAIAAILSAIRSLMQHPAPKRRGIGFTAENNGDT